MTGFLECPLTRPVLAQSWCQTATDGTWYSTTVLPSGRDRSLCLCIIRRRDSEHETRWTWEWRLSSQAAVSPWRALILRNSTGIRNYNGCRGEKFAGLTSFAHTSVPVRSCSALEVCQWITYLAGSSSPEELRAGRTGPTANALLWLQSALKSVRKWRLCLSKLKLSVCPSVRSKIMIIVVRAYEGA